MNMTSPSVNDYHAIKSEPYAIKSAYNLQETEIAETLAEIFRIQHSIAWIEMDKRIARKRLNQSENLKIFVMNEETKKLAGYAIVVCPPLEGKTEPVTWYISQIAVLKELQGRGIGKAIMQEIFDKAISLEVKVNTIILETEGANPKLVQFYRSFAGKEIQVQEEDVGINCFGNLKKIFNYNFVHNPTKLKMIP